ncbi:MinD/ParA family protein [Microbacterium sp. H1-D42]|uniref:MinD/ParA family ATP-binding protein n=1 Tax=Microbacterium sp. H1-D42 TaxID=2925844 RepID=UPI001F53DF34|nr:MinD/ParA family protein [Microbacterium sp. H1-D42]UNK72099.1 AAA family ATPase [Microbacterium sp. H1-D42]
MTVKKSDDPEQDDSLGVLDDTPSSDTTGIGLHGGTAHVNVAMPTGADDDDLVDDETVDGELGSSQVVSDLILDTSAVADADVIARIEQASPEIIIELPADKLPPAVETPADSSTDTDTIEAVAQDEAEIEEGPAITSEIILETEDLAIEDLADEDLEVEDAMVEDAEISDVETVDSEAEVEVAEPEALEPESEAVETEPAEAADTEPVAEDFTEAHAAEVADAETPAGREDSDAPSGASDPASELDAGELSRLESVVAAAKAQLRDAMAPVPPKKPEVASQKNQSSEQNKSSEQSNGSEDATEVAEESTPVVNEDRAPAARTAAEVARTRDESPRQVAEVSLTSKRLDDLGEAGRETADLLTADRLLEPSRLARPEPEGTWSHLLYSITGGRVNVGDSRKARERKQLNARIAAPMAGTARFVPVLSRKGGVGKTTVTALLGMALADARDDRVIAVDANPDRGTLAERVVGSATKSVRDMVRAQHDIRGFHDISAIVARDHTRLDVLASDADPRVSEAFGDADYRDVAAVAAQYYSLVLTDSGTGIVHSVMGATLDLADQIVIVSGLSVDEARLASETLTWLETNGYAELARQAIVVLNQSTPGAPLVRLSELESHFSTRAKHVMRIPYDTQIAGGGAIEFASLQPATRQAARELAAILVEGLRAQAA